MKKTFLILLAILSFALSANAQTRIAGRAEFDRTVYDFGDICISDGPVNCAYTVTNTGKDDLYIVDVVSSCGCTNVKWTKEAIKPGGKGTVTATYKNNEGPVPFDKQLTAYLSGVKQPVILRLRGTSHEKMLPLGELYPVRLGGLALKSTDIPRQNLNQGQQKSGEVSVANPSDTAMKVTFNSVSDGLAVRVDPNPIPAGTSARLIYTFTASRDRWGLNEYYATVNVDGHNCGKLVFKAATKDDFSGLSKEQRASGPNPRFGDSVFTFNPMNAGPEINAVFSLANIGKSPLHIYKIDADSDVISVPDIPDLAPGQSFTFNAKVNTAKLKKGETRIMITLTTNSPLRPIVNLFVTGFIN